MRIGGIEYDTLSLLQREQVIDNLRSLYATVNGVETADVSVQLSQGSLVAQVSVRLPPGQEVANAAGMAVRRAVQGVGSPTEIQGPTRMSDASAVTGNVVEATPARTPARPATEVATPFSFGAGDAFAAATAAATKEYQDEEERKRNQAPGISPLEALMKRFNEEGSGEV